MVSGNRLAPRTVEIRSLPVPSVAQEIIAKLCAREGAESPLVTCTAKVKASGKSHRHRRGSAGSSTEAVDDGSNGEPPGRMGASARDNPASEREKGRRQSLPNGAVRVQRAGGYIHLSARKSTRLAAASPPGEAGIRRILTEGYSRKGRGVRVRRRPRRLGLRLNQACGMTATEI